MNKNCSSTMRRQGHLHHYRHFNFKLHSDALGEESDAAGVCVITEDETRNYCEDYKVNMR